MTESFESRRARWLREAMSKHTTEVNTDRVGRRHARVMADLAREEEWAEAKRVETRHLEGLASGQVQATEAAAHAARVKLIYERLRAKVLGGEFATNEAQRLFNTLTRKP